ncbi:MAG: hypothetical protein Q8L55_00530 [Phycisphaerales bacterium]|nr:hypothetical protein [Phycisphaerales bacterium]
MLVACLPVIISGTTRGRAAYDSLNYHEKAARQFAQELPTPHLKDYLSATTPGYHLVLAAVGRGVGGIGSDGVSAYEKDLTPAQPDPRIASERRVLQLIGLCFTLAMLYLVGHWGEARLRAVAAKPGVPLAVLCLALPLVGSPYIYQSAAWLLPDNSAWLGVLVALLLAVRLRVGPAVIVAMGLVLVWLVLSRQIHAWVAGLVWAAAWVGASAPGDRAGGPLLSLRDLFPRGGSRAVASRVGLAVLCTLPAALVLGWFWRLWDHQLVPPTFVTWHHAGVQAATPAFVLSLIALFAPFFAVWLWPGVLGAWRSQRGWLLGASAAGVLLAVAPATAWDFDHGRFGGVWSLYRVAGEVGGRSLALMVLSPLGAAVVVAVLAGVTVRQRWVMLAALFGFAAANCANPQLWQRYHEPFVLLWLIVAGVLIAERAADAGEGNARRTWRLGGPAVLALVLGAVSVAMVVRARPEIDKGYRPGHIETPPAKVPAGERPS